MLPPDQVVHLFEAHALWEKQSGSQRQWVPGWEEKLAAAPPGTPVCALTYGDGGFGSRAYVGATPALKHSSFGPGGHTHLVIQRNAQGEWSPRRQHDIELARKYDCRSSPIPTPNASRCHRAPRSSFTRGPLRWYRPCTTFQKISTAHQVPLDNETTHQVPSVVPLGRTLVSVSCAMSRALTKTRHAPELRFATLAKTRHDPIADTRALVSGTVINYLYLYFGVLLISFNTIHSILRMVYVR